MLRFATHTYFVPLLVLSTTFAPVVFGGSIYLKESENTSLWYSDSSRPMVQDGKYTFLDFRNGLNTAFNDVQIPFRAEEDYSPIIMSGFEPDLGEIAFHTEQSNNLWDSFCGYCGRVSSDCLSWIGDMANHKSWLADLRFAWNEVVSIAQSICDSPACQQASLETEDAYSCPWNMTVTKLFTPAILGEHESHFLPPHVTGSVNLLKSSVDWLDLDSPTAWLSSLSGVMGMVDGNLNSHLASDFVTPPSESQAADVQERDIPLSIAELEVDGLEAELTSTPRLAERVERDEPPNVEKEETDHSSVASKGPGTQHE